MAGVVVGYPGQDLAGAAAIERHVLIDHGNHENYSGALAVRIASRSRSRGSMRVARSWRVIPLG